jgi:hypothetical protein
MNLAVKLYSSESPDCPEVINGIPLDWPSEVRELGDLTELPDSDWILMTKEDYNIYRSNPDRLAAYSVYWDNIKPKD